MDYKFYIAYDGKPDEQIYPVNTEGLSLVDERLDGEEFYRTVLNGSLIIQNDQTNGYYDYNTVAAINGNVEITLKIKTSCDDYASVAWTGYLSTFDGEFDVDKCQVVFSKIEPDDYYRYPITLSDREYNIYDIADSNPILIPITPTEQTMTYRNTITPILDWTDSVVRRFGGVGWSDPFSSTFGITLRRYRLSWQPNEFWEDGEDGYFYRPYEPSGLTFNAYNPNARLFMDVIKGVYDDMQGSVSSGIVSDFFTSGINPITKTVNRYSGLVLDHISDLNPNISDYATKGMLTFSKLMQWLKDVFQVYWSIDSSGNLVLEHIDWYDSGGGYDTTPGIAIDMTHADREKYIEDTNKYTYLRDGMPQAETWKFGEADGDDFVGEPIEYPQIVSNSRDRNTIINHDLNDLSMDVSHIMGQPEGITSDGFVLLSISGSSLQYIYDDFIDTKPSSLASSSHGISGPDHTIAGIKTNTSYSQGMVTKALFLSRGEEIVIDYNCTVNSGSAPLFAIISGITGDDNTSDGLMVSDIVRTSNGTGTIKLIVGVNVPVWDVEMRGDNAARLVLYNPISEIANYSITFTIGKQYGHVYNEDGVITGNSQLNGPLAIANLHKALWKHHRPYLIGKMNGVDDTVFITLQRFKEQMMFFYPMCCDYFDSPINLLELITTQMGDGKVLKMSLNLGDDTVDFELLHDEENKLKTALSIGGIGVMEIENDNIVG